MPGLEILAFSDEHLDDAAELLRARHERHREAGPLLPADVDYRAQIGGHALRGDTEQARDLYAAAAGAFGPKRGFRISFLRLNRALP